MQYIKWLEFELILFCDLMSINYCNQINLSCHSKVSEKLEMQSENLLLFLEANRLKLIPPTRFIFPSTWNLNPTMSRKRSLHETQRKKWSPFADTPEKIVWESQILKTSKEEQCLETFCNYFLIQTYQPRRI